MARTKVRIGLVGAGFMGRCHANAFRSVTGLFDLPVEPVPEMLADITAQSAQRNAALLGYRRFTADWAQLCCDPDIDIVAVTAPNVLHEPVVMAAIAAGKAVYCEKPLSTTAQSAARMTKAAEAAAVLTLVGFNFLRNPLMALAREILTSGEIGEIISFRGRHAENYMCDPDTPHSFRTDPQGGGALADIGSHITSMARFLLGPLSEVAAQSRTIHATRPLDTAGNDRGPVVVDDLTHALVRFESGVHGSLEANWTATGRSMDLSWEITGTKGALAFTQERMNELLIHNGGAKGRDGFTRVEAGPAHPPYGAFCPAAGHHLGFNDLKVIEVAQLLTAYAAGARCETDFREAWQVQRAIEAMQSAARKRVWVKL